MGLLDWWKKKPSPEPEPETEPPTRVCGKVCARCGGELELGAEGWVKHCPRCKETTLSRRSFLVGAAAGSALVAAGVSLVAPPAAEYVWQSHLDFAARRRDSMEAIKNLYVEGIRADINQPCPLITHLNTTPGQESITFDSQVHKFNLRTESGIVYRSRT